MAKQCFDCRLYKLMLDPADEAAPFYYCVPHGIVLDPAHMSGPTCAEARFADGPEPAPREKRRRKSAPKR